MVSPPRSSKTSHKNSSCIQPECVCHRTKNIFKIFQLSLEAKGYPSLNFSAIVPVMYISEHLLSLGHLF